MMCLKNYFDQGLVNGSRGVVEAVTDAGPEVRWAAGHKSLLKVDSFNYSGGGVTVTRLQVRSRVSERRGRSEATS